jgi:hypothetical protein
MTMGLKVRSLFDDEEVKKKAKKRKQDSDAILEKIYGMLIDKDDGPISETDFIKKKIKKSKK